MKLYHKSIPEIERAVNDIDRPMRWDSAEDIARRFLKAVLDRWHKVEKDLFKLLKDISEDSDAAEGAFPSYQTILNDERNNNKVLDYYEVHKHDSHFHVVQKRGDIKREEITALISQLAQYLTLEQIESIENLFTQYSPQFIAEPFDNKGPIFNKYFPEVIQDGYDQGISRMNQAARRQGASDMVEDLPAVWGFSYDTPFVNEFFGNGFRLVTSKITIAAQGQVLADMLAGFENGDDWRTIARNIHNNVGKAYRYHWKRLVRTEMTSAYYQSMTHTYRETGVSYVKLSLSIGACPICTGLDGFYTMGFEPGIPSETHPNCRCVYIPYFRLPSGVEVRQ